VNPDSADISVTPLLEAERNLDVGFQVDGRRWRVYRALISE